jgi:NADH-quinone oxidoreductase subunit D
MARSSGFKKDLRLSKKLSYSNYNLLKVKSFIGVNGDTYDRFLIRMLEMGESLNIVNNICNSLLTLKHKNYNFLINKYNLNTKLNYTSMEDLINHFLQ